ncbi:MAG: CHAT domain-containing protein [Acidipropionibacterium sp.]|jgi:hypothetical protein|nr:CHAT domain-containing protein [Acidipropionibacterium sp.]
MTTPHPVPAVPGGDDHEEALGLLLVGCDAGDMEYWYWRTELPGASGDPRPSHTAALDADKVNRVEELLSQALPGRIDRMLTGALSDRESEKRFSSALADLLLPEDFQEELWQQYESNGRRPVPVRVLPAQRCLMVPWELLPLTIGAVDDAELRLVEIADISTVAPVLPRDAGSLPAGEDVTEGADEGIPLVVVDPFRRGVGRVLSSQARKEWATRYGAAGPVGAGSPPPSSMAAIGSGIDRIWLSAALTSTRRSRFTYVGHVTSKPRDAASVAMVLGCERRVFSHEDPTRHRYFSARDAVCGTIGAPQLTLQELRERFGVENASGFLVPVVAQGDDGSILEKSGAELWPMPPRVALVACHSGTDLASDEPFGLVTAFMAAGAELVTATRWTLLTDAAFARYDRTPGGVGGPFSEAALRVDRIQSDQHVGEDDPVGRLCAWQREKLDAWRDRGRLRDSPLIWAAFTTYDGRDRRVAVRSGGES